MANQSSTQDVNDRKQKTTIIQLSPLAITAANGVFYYTVIIGPTEVLLDNFELPMHPITAQAARSTISIVSLKVHVDENDYQNVFQDALLVSCWNSNEGELLASVRAERAA
jgi:hypothetical protein